ncbi:MAG: hypothetical protein NVSMB52_18580 [Chloroflexota bacterium]
MQSPAPTTWEERIPREQKWPVLAGLLLVMLLASLDQTIISTALPKVIGDLHGFDRYSWVATAYLLSSTVTVPLYGKLSDLYGRKPLLLFGVVLFLIGSALSGAAHSMNFLIFARGLQGLGAGALLPIVIATFGDLFSPRERGKWQGVAAGVFGFSAIIGPTAGGFITDHFSWRWVFYVNLPVGIIALFVLVVLMPRLQFGHGDIAIDYLGVTLLIVALVPLLLVFTWAGSTYSWTSPQVIGLFAWAIFTLVVFMRVEARTRQPVVDPQLFRNSIYSVSIIVTFLIGAALFGGIFYIPLFIQAVLGSSATDSGTVITPLMVTAMAGSVISGQILSRWGKYKVMAVGGMIFMLAGTALLLRLDVNTHYTSVLLAMVVMGGGLGFGMALYTTIVQNAVSQDMIGQVTSGLTFFRQLGGTIGLAVMGSFLTSRFQKNMATDLSPALRRVIPPSVLHRFDNPQVLISPGAQTSLQHFFAHAGPNGLKYSVEFERTIKLALTSGLHDVFMSTFGIALLATVVVFFLKEIPLRGSTSAETAPDSQGDEHVAIESMPTAQTVR